MPELPEVETCRAGIAPHIEGKTFKSVIVRQSQLRWPIPSNLSAVLSGQCVHKVKRRAKYLIINCDTGNLLLHLGMSGNLRITTADFTPGKHDHLDFIYTDDTVLRFNDQRKFGAVLWCDTPIDKHPLLSKLGPEPLTEEFNADYLLEQAGKRNLAVKSFIMDSHIVVGVGNIYANEALFLAGIHPNKPAGKISLNAYQNLVCAIKEILQQAIIQGGTTLRDFTNHDGKPGYFKQSLRVYGRAKQACLICEAPIQIVKIGQRSSFFCPHCQVA
jgi:formamidopyrimidine-DNA glycosylase